MTATKKQKIRMEKVERLIVPNVIRRFCQNCQSEQIFVSTEQAAALGKLTTRKVFRLVEIGAIHFFETEAGFTNVCLKSLMSFMQVENVKFDLQGNLLERDNL